MMQSFNSKMMIVLLSASLEERQKWISTRKSLRSTGSMLRVVAQAKNTLSERCRNLS